MAQNNDDIQGQMVLNRWARDREKQVATSEAAEKSLGKFLKEALRNPNTLKNLAKQGVDVAKERRTIDQFLKKNAAGEGFGISDEAPVTGFEPRPWEKD